MSAGCASRIPPVTLQGNPVRFPSDISHSFFFRKLAQKFFFLGIFPVIIPGISEYPEVSVEIS